MSIILATSEGEVGGSVSEAWTGKKHETPSKSKPKLKKLEHGSSGTVLT
jgi:hypothetical protein